MAATINDKFNETTNGTRPDATTVTGTRSAAGTTLQCAALTGWPTATAVHFATYRTDAQGDKVAGSQCDWKGIVSGTQLTNLTLKAGTDVGNAIGETVVCMPTAAWADDVVEGISVEHDQDGTHGVVTATSVATSGSVTAGNGLNVTSGAVSLPAGALETADYADDSVTDTKLDYPRWWQEIGRTTLGSAGDTITVSSLPARKYLRLIYFHIATGGTTTAVMTFNGDTGANYATRASSDQGATATATSGTSVAIQSTAFQSDVAAIIDILNVATVAKSVIIRAEIIAGAATTAPGSRDVYGKWVNTSAQISSITITNTGAGDFNTGSELIVLGHD